MIRVTILALAAALFWGVNQALIAKYLSNYSPLVNTIVQTLVTFAVVVPLAVAMSRSQPLAMPTTNFGWSMAALVGLLYTIGILCFFWGYKIGDNVPGAAMIIALMILTQPLWFAVAQFALQGTQPRFAHFLAFLLVVCAIVTLIVDANGIERTS